MVVSLQVTDILQMANYTRPAMIVGSVQMTDRLQMVNYQCLVTDILPS